MKKVVLIFPNTGKIADFILKYKVAKAEVNSSEQTLAAALTEDMIIIACTEYGAALKKMTQFNPS